jgi:hypothetical protein
VTLDEFLKFVADSEADRDLTLFKQLTEKSLIVARLSQLPLKHLVNLDTDGILLALEERGPA